MTSPKLNYDEINEYIHSSHPQSVIMIGCDSLRKETRGKAWATYSTVVCVRKASGSGADIMYHGSRVFGASLRLPDYGRVIKSGKLANLKTRMIQEVTFALEAYENVYEAIGDRPFEIHLDINSRPECESHVAMAEARGSVFGNPAPQHLSDTIQSTGATIRAGSGLGAQDSVFGFGNKPGPNTSNTGSVLTVPEPFM